MASNLVGCYAFALIMLFPQWAIAQPQQPSWYETKGPGIPAGRTYFTFVWTGTEIIIWGGNQDGVTTVNTGYRYNPSTDVWTAISNVNAPSARSEHTAVWTGTEMIVWGGIQQSGLAADTGGRYDPLSDSWTATSNAPLGRAFHSAVWTGTDMIIWGGTGPAAVPPYLNTGLKYNPGSDSWTPISTTDAPGARREHTAIWTGLAMVVWGGMQDDGMGIGGANPTMTGGRYFPGTDTWLATSTSGAPLQWEHTAIWTGSEMIIWGGYSSGLTNSGARYDPILDSWTSVTTTKAPAGRSFHSSAWISDRMIIWGGIGGSGYLHEGGVYDPASDEWVEQLVMGSPRSSPLPGAASDSKLYVWDLEHSLPEDNDGGCGLLGVEVVLVLGVLLFLKSVAAQTSMRRRIRAEGHSVRHSALSSSR